MKCYLLLQESTNKCHFEHSSNTTSTTTITSTTDSNNDNDDDDDDDDDIYITLHFINVLCRFIQKFRTTDKT